LIYFYDASNFQILCPVAKSQPDIDNADDRAIAFCKLKEIEPKLLDKQIIEC